CKTTTTTNIYTLSLHDALPIYLIGNEEDGSCDRDQRAEHEQDDEGDALEDDQLLPRREIGQEEGQEQHHDRDEEEDEQHPLPERSEEHTSELQSLAYLVCRLLL